MDEKKETLESKIQKIASRVNFYLSTENIPESLISDSITEIESAFAEEFSFKNVSMYAFQLKDPETGLLVPFTVELYNKWKPATIWQVSLQALLAEEGRNNIPVEYPLTRQPPRHVLLTGEPYQSWWDEESYLQQVKQGIFDMDYKLKFENLFKYEKYCLMARMLGEEEMLEKIKSYYNKVVEDAVRESKADHLMLSDFLDSCFKEISKHINYELIKSFLHVKNDYYDNFEKWRKGLLFRVSEGILLAMEWPNNLDYTKPIPEWKIRKSQNAVSMTSTIILGLKAAHAMTKQRDEIANCLLGSQVAQDYVRNRDVRPQKKNITVFFADLRDFTGISNKMPLEYTVSMLNDYLSEMTKIILEKEGIVDKFIGDGIMAYWGTPLNTDHAVRCCETALLMKARLPELRKKYPELDFKIGIASGEVIAAMIGLKQRPAYTILGQAANICSRLEGVNKEFGTNIIISDETRKILNDKFLTRWLGYSRVQGVEEPLKIYELVCFLDEADEGLVKMIRLFEDAVSLYHNNDDNAYDIFLRLSELGDRPSKAYVRKMEDLKKGSGRVTKEFIIKKA